MGDAITPYESKRQQSILPYGFQELGRIRTGDKGKTKNGKEYPKRLDKFRLTSSNKPRLIAASRLDYIGGEVIDWPEAPQGKQYQLYTDTDMMPVIVPPFNAFSQQNEIWQGGECRLRCDGESITHCAKNPERVGNPCWCANMGQAERLAAAKEGKACQTVTRLNLMLPDIPGIGVWRIETRSYYAGIELQGASGLLQDAAANGLYINAWLQIETRSVRRRNEKGDIQTQVFPVITLQPEITMRQLISRKIPDEMLIGPPSVSKMIDDVYGDELPRLPQGDTYDTATGEVVDDDLPDPDVPASISMLDEIEALAKKHNILMSALETLMFDKWQVKVWESVTPEQYGELIEALGENPAGIKKAVAAMGKEEGSLL